MRMRSRSLARACRCVTEYLSRGEEREEEVNCCLILFFFLFCLLGNKTVQGKLRRLCVIQSAADSAADEAGILQASAFLSVLKCRGGEASVSLRGRQLHM